jgi:putative hemolysin
MPREVAGLELLRLVLLVVLLLFSAYFSSAETALFSLHGPRRGRLRQQPGRVEKLILQLLASPRALLATILVGNTVVNLFLSVLAAGLFTAHFGEAQGPWLATGVMTVVLLLFGEIAPKTFAVGAPLRTSRFVAPGLHALSIFLRPISAFSMRISDAIGRRLQRPEAPPREILTEEEIKTLVTMGSEEGVLESRETEFIHNVFLLHDRRVQDLMTPRVRVFTLDITSVADAVRDAVALAGYSRIPVYEDREENLVGYVEATDLLWEEDTPDTRTLRQMLRPLRFYPETKDAGDLLREMHHDAVHFAGVVDEHGGFAGVVSLEDAVEQVVGEIRDLHDVDRFHVTWTPEGDAIVAAHMELRVLNSLLGLSLVDPQAETIGGLVINRLGSIPRPGMRLVHDGVTLVVESAAPNRILKLRVLGQGSGTGAS